MKKWEWIKDFGERAHVVGRLVFVETEPQYGFMFNVYENDWDGDVMTVADIRYGELSGTVFAVHHGLEPKIFYEADKSLWRDWFPWFPQYYGGKPSARRKRKALKEVEKSFFQQRSNFK